MTDRKRIAALAAVAALAAGPALAATPSIVGAWRLVETRQVLADGTVRPAPDVGPRPQGWMMYDASGHMCMSFKDSTRPRWASATEPTEAELRTMFTHTVNYCARYRVDASRGVIVLDEEFGVSPNSAGSSRERRFELKGDKLIIYPPLAAGVTAATVHLERARR